MNERKIDRVARNICYAAGVEHSDNGKCRVCDGKNPDQCQMVTQFRNEAIAAINSMKGF